MATATDTHRYPSRTLTPRAGVGVIWNIGTVAIGALPLLWPAFYNRYPLVFADTGTYLSQAINRYIGWDRPVFYSLFMLPLHLTLTTWPVLIVQALLTSYLLHLTQRALLPRSSMWWLPVLTTLLATATSLPWFVSQLMPDLFTPLLVLVVALLLFAPDELRRGERYSLMLLATFMLTAHLTNLPLIIFLLAVLLPFGHARVAWLIAPITLATAALLLMNVIGPGRAGSVFLLARVLYDGPGMTTLERECPRRHWRLCGYLGKFPPNADDFLWQANSPLRLAGGPSQLGGEAIAIVAATLRTQPLAEMRAFLTNARRQVSLFATGDGLQPWPAAVTPWIVRDFPSREATSYLAARQQRGDLTVPPWLQHVHRAAALAGVAGCVVALWLGWRPRHVAGGIAAMVLLALLGNAAIAGGLSGPHDRYQSRVIWLAPAIAVLALPSLLWRHGLAAK